MPLRVKATYKGFIPEMKKSQLNTVLKQSYAELGVHFFVENLPRRFTFAGGRRLGFKRRTNKHNKRKGHADPMVFSGKTRERVLSLPMGFTRIFATAQKGQGKAWLTINAPALNFKRPTGPNMREEIERIATAEVPPLERFLEKKTESNFNKFTESTTETIG